MKKGIACQGKSHRKITQTSALDISELIMVLTILCALRREE